ncbi:MAG: bifunctional serine/threonine-protein kinase/formylglycine-generating enzyme family protein [Pseudomonadota bacterium]
MRTSARVRGFLGEAGKGFALELLAAVVPGGGLAAMAGRAFGGAAVKGVFAWLEDKPTRERQAVLDELAGLSPDTVRAIVLEELSRLDLGTTGAQRQAALDLAARTCEAIPFTVRQASKRPNDGGRTQTLASQLPRDPGELQRFLPSRVPSLAPGREMPGDWVLDRLLGQGGFGEVWLARGRFLGEEVRALKVCLDPEIQVSLRREVTLLAKARSAGGHANVVEIAGTSLGTEPPFLTLEYVAGGDLAGWAAGFGPRVPPEAVREALAQIGAGLAFAHGLGIVHRDLKPANVLVGADGTLKIADLGIGALIGPKAGAATLTGQTTLGGSGTPTYQDERRLFAPPEPIDDIYALGVIGVQLLLGDVHRRLPYEWPEDLAEARVPEDLIALLRACLGRPERRPKDGAAFLERLNQPVRRTRTTAPAREGGGLFERLTQWARAAPLKPRWQPLSRFRDPLAGGGKGPEMVVVPAGSFIMGAPESEKGSHDNERPQHPVRFASPFALARHTVTSEEYDTFCAATGHEKPEIEHDWTERLPVEVNWDSARAYCRWLSQQTGAEYRLPSEAEWEYACRAGTTTPFHFGPTITPDQAAYNWFYPYGDTPIGRMNQQIVAVDAMPLAENGWGLRHMHGNTQEWCEDTYNASYDGAPADGSAWTTGEDSMVVVRGGSNGSGAVHARSAWRNGAWRNTRLSPAHISWHGFRVARTLNS